MSMSMSNAQEERAVASANARGAMKRCATSLRCASSDHGSMDCQQQLLPTVPAPKKPRMSAHSTPPPRPQRAAAQVARARIILDSRAAATQHQLPDAGNISRIDQQDDSSSSERDDRPPTRSNHGFRAARTAGGSTGTILPLGVQQQVGASIQAVTPIT